ncbi:MAG: recombinase RecT, partial [Bacilli bacterium]
MPVLQSCSKESICNALLDMTIQGLSPSKKQCYFVPYNGKLQLMKSYLGNIAATKRLKGVKDVFANIIYKGDEFA